MSEINIVCIGHCCHDKTDEGYILGGTASYAAFIAKKLGQHSEVLTSVGDDFLFLWTFCEEDIPLTNVCAENTTIFENIYEENKRTQYIFNRAKRITAQDIPDRLLDAEIVLIGTIADEVDFSVVQLFGKSLIAGAIQGSLRSWDKNGLIAAKDMNYQLLQGIDIIILSKEDLTGLNDPLPKIKKYVSHLVITSGTDGATIYKDDEEYFYPSYPANELDATGAGDTFAVAYILEYNKTQSVKEACIYAHCAASLIIEHEGLSNLPRDTEIRSRVNEYLSTGIGS